MHYKHTGITAIRRGIFARLGLLLDKLNIDLTQKELASSLGVSTGSISRLIKQNDRMPSTELMLTLCDKLEVNYRLTVTSHKGVVTTSVEMAGVSEYDFRRTVMGIRSKLSSTPARNKAYQSQVNTRH